MNILVIPFKYQKYWLKTKKDQYDIKFLRKNLLTNISQDYALQMIVWWAQNNYKRQPWMERIDLNDNEYADKENKKFYIKQLKTLNLFSEIVPNQNTQYDYIWILGAARETLLNRIEHYKLHRGRLKEDGDVFVLTAADREIWAQIDSLSQLKRSKISNQYITKYHDLGY